MGIPNETKIGILGAGGKMGLRISANLKKLPNEIFYIENAETGIERLQKNGLKVSAPAMTLLNQVDVLILAVPDKGRLQEGLDRRVFARSPHKDAETRPESRLEDPT